jgi:hypothetical protein
MSFLQSDYLHGVLGTFLLLIILSLSGCGTILDILTRNRQHEEDKSSCQSQCRGFTERGDFAHCVNACMFEKGVERRRMEEKWKDDKKKEELKKISEKEEAARDEQLMDKVDKALRKTNENRDPLGATGIR